MDVLSLSPFRVASLVWQPARGGYVLTVVCKVTFDLVPVTATLARHQDEPNADDPSASDDPARGARAPSDMAPFKPRGDVLLVGHAFAPRGEPVTLLVARLVVGKLDKALEVTEVTRDRSLARDGGNPLAPAGFGPLAPTSRERAERLGPHAGLWPAKGWTERPLPEGLDPSYFNAAPRDQQLEVIRGDEPLVLENLHPSSPRLVTNLPGIRPQAFVEMAGKAPHELNLTCDTLFIDTDRSACALTWRGQLPIPHPSQAGRVLVAMAQAGQRLAWGDVERLDRKAPARGSSTWVEVDEDEDDERQRTVAPDEAARLRAALPFARAGGAPLSAPVSAPVFGPAPVSAPASAPVSAPVAAPAPAPVSASVSAPAPVSASVSAPAPVPAPVFPPAPAPAFSPAPIAAPALVPSSVSALNPAPWTTPSGSPSVAKAAQSGAAAASDAAAGASAPFPSPTVDPPKQPPTAEAPIAKEGPRELLDLLWFDKDAVRRMRANKAWASALAEPDEGEWLDAHEPYEPLAEARDRASVLRILTRAKSIAPEELLTALGSAVDESGVLSAPLVLMTGELTVTFDEIEALKAMVTAIAPLAGADKRLRDALDAATEVLRSPWPISSGLADGLTARLKEAFAQGVRTLPQGYLESASERALLEQRRFQRRTILGQVRLRCLFTPAGGASPAPAYLPESLAPHLPMFQRLRVKIAAEAQPQQDQHEAHPVALLTLALGRVLPVPFTIPARPAPRAEDRRS